MFITPRTYLYCYPVKEELDVLDAIFQALSRRDRREALIIIAARRDALTAAAPLVPYDPVVHANGA